MMTQIDQHIAEMRSGELGPDYLVVSTPSSSQARYWKKRLDGRKGSLIPAHTEIITVVETWKGGAGNGLGTLDAFAQTDLLGQLEAGCSVFLYHTAGKGQRLAPLPLAEGNNKSAVQLPELVNGLPLTLLEAVIRQTSILAPYRPGRLSVFWGDQLFVPSVPLADTVHHHVDILTKIQPLPSEETWNKQRLYTYGLICVDAEGDIQQLEKSDFSTLHTLIQKGLISVSGGVGLSLGSFSLSFEMTAALLDEFEPELASQEGQLDTDPHFWMPLSLDRATYVPFMVARGVDETVAREYHERMRLFGNQHFPHLERVLGCTDIGGDAYWWDFGSLSRYSYYLRKMLGTDHEGETIRAFFGNPPVENGNLLVDSNVPTENVRDSILFQTQAKQATIDHSVLIGVQAETIDCHGALAYHVKEDGLSLTAGQARAAELQTQIDSDGKADWEKVLPGNSHSYAEVYETNRS
jgi:hypothetical protein